MTSINTCRYGTSRTGSAPFRETHISSRSSCITSGRIVHHRLILPPRGSAKVCMGVRVKPYCGVRGKVMLRLGRAPARPLSRAPAWPRCQDRGWSLRTTPTEPWRGVTRQVTDPSAGPQRGLPSPQPPGQRPGHPRLPSRPFHPSDHRPGPPSRRPCAQDGLKGKIVAKRYSCDSHGGGAGFGNASSDRPRIRGDGEGTGARAFHLRTAQAR